MSEPRFTRLYDFRKLSEPRFIGLEDFLDFRIQLLSNSIIPKSSESLNSGPILVQTVVDEGGLAKMWKLFGGDTEKLIEEINEELAA